MELTLTRKIRTDKTTIGELSVNGKFECFTLEDVERAVKIKGRSAIPKGRYRVIISFSQRFQQYMPEILNVPGFTGIRIHSGNTADDTEGCPLTGQTKGTDFVGNSRIAYRALLAKLTAVEKREQIYIEIR